MDPTESAPPQTGPPHLRSKKLLALAAESLWGWDKPQASGSPGQQTQTQHRFGRTRSIPRARLPSKGQAAGKQDPPITQCLTLQSECVRCRGELMSLGVDDRSPSAAEASEMMDGCRE